MPDIVPKATNKIFSVQSAKYIIVAAIGYVFDLGLLIYLHNFLGLNYSLAATAGFIVGGLIQYVLSDRYVFGESKLNHKTSEVTSFIAIGVVGLIILNIVMFIFISGLELNYIIAKVIATIFVYIWNFLARDALYHDE